MSEVKILGAGTKAALAHLGTVGAYALHVVEVDGEPVAVIRKRREVYTGIKRGGTYTYWDAYHFKGAHFGAENRVVHGASTRRQAADLAVAKLEGR